MSLVFNIICLITTLYTFAFTDTIKYIILSFNAYTNKVKNAVLI